MEKKKIAQAMSEKLEYICLDLEQIPETLKYVENINFKPNIGIEENKYMFKNIASGNNSNINFNFFIFPFPSFYGL